MTRRMEPSPASLLKLSDAHMEAMTGPHMTHYVVEGTYCGDIDMLMCDDCGETIQVEVFEESGHECEELP